MGALFDDSRRGRGLVIEGLHPSLELINGEGIVRVEDITPESVARVIEGVKPFTLQIGDTVCFEDGRVLGYCERIGSNAGFFFRSILVERIKRLPKLDAIETMIASFGLYVFRSGIQVHPEVKE